MKKIRSTILVNTKAFIHISNICRNHKTSLNEIVEKAIHNMVLRELSCNRLKTFETVKYQERGGEYVLVHYSIDPKIYESLLDIRKLRKLSISRLLSEFIKIFLTNKNDAECCFILFFGKLDRNQFNYKIASQFNEKSQTFTFTIQAKLE